jgi:hypothetical protein
MAYSQQGDGRNAGRSERMAARNLALSLNRGSVPLKQRHVDQLVRSLRELGSTDGDAIAEEIASLALAGVRIDLRLGARELNTFASAVVGLTAPSGPVDPSFSRLLAYIREEEAR